MLIREFHDSDLAQLRVIHAAQGFDYPFPDLTNPLFVTKLILTNDPERSDVSSCSSAALSPAQSRECCAITNEDAANKVSGDDTILGAAFLRLTAEAYLLLDPRAGTPRHRWQWLLALHHAAARDAWQRGLEDVHAWLPPPIATKFGKRLERLGWLRDDTWTPYCKRLGQGISRAL